MHRALCTHDQIRLAAQVGGNLAGVKRLQAHRPDLFEGGSMSAEKLARHRSYRKVLKYGSLLSPFTAPLAWWALRKWDDHEVRALHEDDRVDPT